MLWKVIKLRYCLLFQCPILHKTPITGGVCVVSGGVCLVSGMYTRTEEVSWWSNTKSIGKIWIRPYLDIALSSSTFYCKKHLCLLMSGWCYFEGVWIMSRWCLRVSGEASMPNLFMILRYCLSSSARNSYHLNPVLSAAVRILESFDMMIMIGKVKCLVWWLSTYSMMMKRIELHEE